jgi:hypothetical protein
MAIKSTVNSNISRIKLVQRQSPIRVQPLDNNIILLNSTDNHLVTKHQLRKVAQLDRFP